MAPSPEHVQLDDIIEETQSLKLRLIHLNEKYRELIEVIERKELSHGPQTAETS